MLQFRFYMNYSNEVETIHSDQVRFYMNISDRRKTNIGDPTISLNFLIELLL